MPNDYDNAGTPIAVLPSDNFSVGAERDYFSRGFVEDVITDLAHFDHIQVISSYTTAKIGAVKRDALAEDRDLAFDFLLKGSLPSQDDQLRINTQLVETSGGEVLWAERYNAPLETVLETVLEIQDDIVSQVVDALSSSIADLRLAAARRKITTAHDSLERHLDNAIKTGSRCIHAPEKPLTWDL
jgi:adenylate cyclase